MARFLSPSPPFICENKPSNPLPNLVLGFWKAGFGKWSVGWMAQRQRKREGGAQFHGCRRQMHARKECAPCFLSHVLPFFLSLSLSLFLCLSARPIRHWVARIGVVHDRAKSSLAFFKIKSLVSTDASPHLLCDGLPPFFSNSPFCLSMIISVTHMLSLVPQKDFFFAFLYNPMLRVHFC
ncbi:hypothetical protein BC940DRAFT_82000 [Gongronella butleri]|nr:hypothetical protein BC940DRAFT_82000 [Gongronella butleri]